jgi:hypothetical protein
LLLYDPSVVVGFVWILAVVWRWFAVPAEGRRCECLLLIAIFTLIANPVAQAIADSLSRLRPMKMDLYAYLADGWLGQPAFALGRAVAPHLGAKVLLNVAYGLLPIGVIVTLSAHVLAAERGRERDGVGVCDQPAGGASVLRAGAGVWASVFVSDVPAGAGSCDSAHGAD